MLHSNVTPGKIYGPIEYKGRRYVTIESTDGTKRNMTYARWMLQEHLGRKLTPIEHVHHVDENPLNDMIENLVIRNPTQHRYEHSDLPKLIVFICPECHKQTIKLARTVKHNHRLGKEGPYCGRQCAGKVNARKRL